MPTTLEDQRNQLEAAIAGLEAQRPILGDAVVETALASMRRQLAAMVRPAEPAPLAEAEGERKLVTVMFADIAGFTALAETLDAEEVRALMNACFERLVPVVEKYGGTVDKFVGDQIMALFGAPVAHENDAERALRTALEMMRALEEFNAGQGTHLGLHIGVNTGLVVAGGIGSTGRQQYSVMGDAVNLAARLEDASERGDIFVGPDTHRLAAPLFDFEALPALRVKGKAEPVPVYRLLQLKALPGATRGIEGLSSPLVGRDAELERLHDAFRALEHGRGGTIAVIGEAGQGKSRLVAEARQEVAAGVTWAGGRALSYAEGMSYWVARDVLRAVLGVKADAPPAEIAAAVEASVAQVVPDQSDSVFPYLAYLLDAPLSASMQERVRHLGPDVLQRQILRAVVAYLRAQALMRPLVLEWEDLHWADPSSLLLLRELLPLAETAPLLLLLVFRSNEGRIWDFHEEQTAAGREAYQTIELAPLSRDESTALLHNFLRIENLPEKTRELILDRAEGNAFFLEEVLRSLIDAGLVVLEGGKAVARQAIGDLHVPDTLHGVVMARVDRLPAEHKHTLQTASVIGRVFQDRVLQYLLQPEMPSDLIEPSLAELQRREFVRLWLASLPVEGRPEHDYIFKHVVTQQVTYDSLLRARRKELHRVTGEAIEALFPDRIEEFAAPLAYHFEQATVRDKALHYLRRAAGRAAAVYANAEAIAYYRRALALLEEPGRGGSVAAHHAAEASQLYEGLADVLKLAGQHEEARDVYQRALGHCDGDVAQQSHLLDKIGNTWQIQRRYEEAFQAWDQAEAALDGSPDERGESWWQAWIQIQLDRLWAHYFLNNAGKMAEIVDRTRPAVEQHGTLPQRGLFFQRLALMGFRRDRFAVTDETLGHAQEFVEAIREAGNLSELAFARFVLGCAHLWRGRRSDLDEAEAELEGGLKLAERIGDVVVQTRCLAYLPMVYRKRGQVNDVRRVLPRSLAMAQTTDMGEYIATAEAHATWLAWHDGQFAEAEEHGRAFLQLWQAMPLANPFTWPALWPLIDIALAEDRLAEAIGHVQTFVRPQEQRKPPELEAALQDALRASENDQPQVARTALQRAVALAKEMEYL